MRTVKQHLAPAKELMTAVKLIHAGLGQLQRISAANHFYYPARKFLR